MVAWKAKKGGAANKKKRKGGTNKDWAFEGGAFDDGRNDNDDGRDAGGADDADAAPRKRRRMTQALQDQKRRGLQRVKIRQKERSIAHKFKEARLARAPAPPPPPKPRRHKKKKRPLLNDGEEKTAQNRYTWIHQTKDDEQAAAVEGEGENGHMANGHHPSEEKGVKSGKDKGAYALLMAGLAGRNSQSKYKDLLEQRRREQEGLTESEEEEKGDDEEGEDEEGSEEASEEEGAAKEVAANGIDASESEEDGEEKEEEVDEEEEEEEEEEAADQDQAEEAAEEENEEDDTGDAFVQHWQRGPLEDHDGDDEESDEEDGGTKLRTLGTWTSQQLGESEGVDPFLIQGSGGSGGGSRGLSLPASRDPSRCPHLRQMLKYCWEGVNGGRTTAMQSHLYPLLASYKDILFGGLTMENLAEVQLVVLLHVLNHILKGRSRVLRHNLRRRKEAKAARVARVSAAIEKELGEDWNDEEEDDGLNGKRKKAGVNGNGNSKATLDVDDDQDRDQGYTRPRVLLLLPMRHDALKAIKAMIALLGPKTSVIGMERLEESYGAAEGEEGDREAEGRTRKPEDWQMLFDGNCDDDFKLGVAFTPGQGKGKGAGKGVAVKLFAEFYHSDLIIASPLGLRLAMESQKDHDFLSSIEILALDQTDVLLMQNCDHVVEVLRVMNQAPTKDHNTDFSRVRHYVLEGQAARFRQTLFLSRFLDPLLLAAFNKSCRSFEGKYRIKRCVEEGSICQVALRVKQVFTRIPCSQPRLQGDARFEYMIKSVLPEIKRLKQSHTLLFIPSYYDFVRLRNYAVREELSHVCVSEYERVSETSRSRARFFHGQRDLMLYTGRAHFFKRYMIRGAHHLVFYSLPECSQFFPELVNLLEEAEGSAQVTSCFVLFTKYEAMALERIVGTKRSRHMLTSEKSTFLFC